MANDPQILSRTQLRRAASDCFCNGARKAARAMTQLYDAALEPSGLGANQFSLMTAIALMGPVALGRLAEQIVMDRTTLTRNLRPLEKANLVDSVPGKDRRMREIRLTSAGREKLAAAIPLWEQAHRDMSRRLSLGPFDAEATRIMLDHAISAARANHR